MRWIATAAAIASISLTGCNATKMSTWQVPPRFTAEQAMAENEECRQRTDKAHPEFGTADLLPYVGVMFSLHRDDVREAFYLDCMRGKGFEMVATETGPVIETRWVSPGMANAQLDADEKACKGMPEKNATAVAECMRGRGHQLWTADEIRRFSAATSEPERKAVLACTSGVVRVLPLDVTRPVDPAPRAKLRDACLAERGVAAK